VYISSENSLKEAISIPFHIMTPRIETFEFLPKPGKSSFLRKQESSPFNGFIDSRFRGNDKKVRFSKVSN